MTVSVNTNRVVFAGTDDGVTGPFPFNFPLAEAGDILVVKRDNVYWNQIWLRINVDFTVQYTNGDPGGSVTLMDPLFTGYAICIYRQTWQFQWADYVEHDPFSADTHEFALDKLTMEVQDLEEQVSRAIQFRISGNLTNRYYPKPIPYYLLGWNFDGTEITQYPPGGSGGGGGTPLPITTQYVALDVWTGSRRLESYEVLYIYMAVFAFVLPMNLPDSQAVLLSVPASDTFTVSIQKNDVEVGTIGFTPADGAGSVSLASDVSFAVGDKLSLVAPVQDDKASGFAATFKLVIE